MNIREILTDAVILAPLTRGSNLPYRRLCVEQGARVTVSEMVTVRNLRQRRKMEFALMRRAPEESVYGVQLIGRGGEDMAWGAALAEERGADFVDVNMGCPIDAINRHGVGAVLGRQPRKIREIVQAMKKAVQRVPVTVKIRLGWGDEERNHLDQAQAAVDGGADAIFVHGRTRNARYRGQVDWDAIGEIVAAVSVPVVGNGDILFPHQIREARERSGCVGVMVGRGALIKPWIFREATEGYLDLGPEERLDLYRRYLALAREHWDHGERSARIHREFLAWHLAFWSRYNRRRDDGRFPTMQEREATLGARSPLEELLGRGDRAAIAWLADRLMAGDAVDPAEAPAPSGDDRDVFEMEG